MAVIEIRDVPTEVHDRFAARAREIGQSLRSYLRDVVVREDRLSANVRVIDEISAWRGRGDFTVEDVLAVLDAGRRGACMSEALNDGVLKDQGSRRRKAGVTPQQDLISLTGD